MIRPHILLTVFLVTSLSLTSFSQGTISGRITDAESGDPLTGASVFAQNTTKGTITDSGGRYGLYLPKGGYEIVISFTGYVSRTINLELSGDREFNLTMQKAENEMSEVIIRNTFEVADGWEKYGDFFLKNFIGSTPFATSCYLVNPEVLKFYFYTRSNKLKVMAAEPLQVANYALGYNMRYELDSFIYLYNVDITSYRGNCLYTPMDPQNDSLHRWVKNRQDAYYGSRLHFMRSYYDSTLKAEGYSVDILSSSVANKFDRLANPYSSNYYYFDTATGIAELGFPAKVSIVYNKKPPEKEYLKQYGLPLNVTMQLSYVDLLDPIFIKSNGYFTEQKSWFNEGYWSWKNLADQLPYDYDPVPPPVFSPQNYK